MKKQTVIGCMSGTSTDGLDLAACTFLNSQGKWHFELLEAETIPYPDPLRDKLLHCRQLSGWELTQLDQEWGAFTGDAIGQFIKNHSIAADLIGSHGHTVFHRPKKQITLQIGCGSEIHSRTRIPVVNDFRRLHVRMGGQGAPLVPVGDEMLFDSYGACVNLGGFSNISYSSAGKRKAKDIFAHNLLLDHLAGKFGKAFDDGGAMGRNHHVNSLLMEELDRLTVPGVSLGAEWVEEQLLPLLDSYPAGEALATVYPFLADKLAAAFNQIKDKKPILLTGGGAKNTYLVELLKKRTTQEIEIPSSWLVDFKEAIIFAFLALLRVRNEINVYSSASGGPDLCAGTIVDNLNQVSI